MNMRTESHIKKFVAERSRKEAAMALGCTPWAVSLALRDQRDIRIELGTAGEAVGFYEIKRPRRGVNLT
jgi:hypothetical protein